MSRLRASDKTKTTGGLINVMQSKVHMQLIILSHVQQISTMLWNASCIFLWNKYFPWKRIIWILFRKTCAKKTTITIKYHNFLKNRSSTSKSNNSKKNNNSNNNNKNNYNDGNNNKDSNNNNSNNNNIAATMTAMTTTTAATTTMATRPMALWQQQRQQQQPQWQPQHTQ